MTNELEFKINEARKESIKDGLKSMSGFFFGGISECSALLSGFYAFSKEESLLSLLGLTVGILGTYLGFNYHFKKSKKSKESFYNYKSLVEEFDATSKTSYSKNLRWWILYEQQKFW